MGRRIIAQAMLHVGERAAAGDVEPEGAEAEVQNMAVGVDQARQNRRSFHVDDRRSSRPAVTVLEQADDLAVVADHDPAEMLELSVGAGLPAIRMVYEGNGPGRRGEEGGGGKRERGSVHRRRIALSPRK